MRGAGASEKEAAVHRAYSAFENMVTGVEQRLIAPSERWYVCLNIVSATQRSPEVCLAEISTDGRIFSVHRANARHNIEERCVRQLDCAKCPFFSKDGPDSFIQEWNKNIRGNNRELLQLERVATQGCATPIEVFIDRSRSIVYHYSGFSLIVQTSKASLSGPAKTSAQFITVLPKKKSFIEWRARE
jgi:hypothetical protein